MTKVYDQVDMLVGVDKKPARLKRLKSTDRNVVHEFLRKNTPFQGFTVQYFVGKNGAGERVIYELFKKGKPSKRVIKQVIDLFHAEEWMYSWAFATPNWRMEDGRLVEAIKLDLVTAPEVYAWARMNGMVPTKRR